MQQIQDRSHDPRGHKFLFNPFAWCISCTPIIFENLTIEISTHNKRFIVDNIEQFNNLFDNHLCALNDLRKAVFVVLDANINLLNLSSNKTATEYLNCILSHGFLPTNVKATWMQANSFPLIDHILCNIPPDKITSGTLISDISNQPLHKLHYSRWSCYCKCQHY
jgi:hypothetical protein